MTMTASHRSHGLAVVDHELIDELLTMDTTAFYDVVDQDIRNSGNRRDKDTRMAAALRSREVVERWFQALVRMKKSTEMTIAAKATDNKVRRSKLELERELRKASEQHLGYLQWRAGALRFLTGVEERLTEANYWRRIHFASAYPDAVIAERDRLSQAVLALRAAIKEHRDAFPHDENPSDVDEELWAVLSDAEDDDDIDQLARSIAQLRETLADDE